MQDLRFGANRRIDFRPSTSSCSAVGVQRRYGRERKMEGVPEQSESWLQDLSRIAALKLRSLLIVFSIENQESTARHAVQ